MSAAVALPVEGPAGDVLRLHPAVTAAPAPVAPSALLPPPLLQMLVESRALDPGEALARLGDRPRSEAELIDALLSEGLVSQADLTQALARRWRRGTADLFGEPPDPRLISRLGLDTCLRLGVLPWRDSGGLVHVATARPEASLRHRAALEERLGPVSLVIAPQADIDAALIAAQGRALGLRAETRVAAEESCRGWSRGASRAGFAATLAILALAVLVAPMALFWLAAAWAGLTLAATIALKALAALAVLTRRRAESTAGTVVARLPVVSLIVPLFHERDIAARLVRRLERLDYPREFLDIVLVVEAEDDSTRRALAGAQLPGWMRVLTAPPGSLKTKPRAMNVALDFCRGSIIGIYDAEDAPAPDQIARVVQRFHERDERVACLQGVLDFYNPRTNWLSRCFTMEYAAWFRIVLPGLERLGLAFPLGGTTLFFRREALEALGGWDAHNVTEDADLGIRLARHGYRAEFLDSVTEEEANCRAMPWIRQRSRWLKGYMMTWAVHSRRPLRLWRELGTWKFLGFQVMFLGTISQYLLAPVLWSLWLWPLGYGGALSALPAGAMDALFALFLIAEGINLAVGAVALRGPAHRGLIPWLPSLHIYFPLGALAAYKALSEMLVAPFYWDKTRHGLFDPLA